MQWSLGGACSEGEYTCTNTRCILASNRCDGVCDCGNICDDELHCGNYLGSPMTSFDVKTDFKLVIIIFIIFLSSNMCWKGTFKSPFETSDWQVWIEVCQTPRILLSETRLRKVTFDDVMFFSEVAKIVKLFLNSQRLLNLKGSFGVELLENWGN